MSAPEQIRAFVDRILRVMDEVDALKADIRDIYAEAKGTGFDKTALGQVVTICRKRAKDPDGFEERSAIVELYLSAYHGREASHTHAYAREEQDWGGDEPSAAGVTPADGRVVTDAHAAGRVADESPATFPETGEHCGGEITPVSVAAGQQASSSAEASCSHDAGAAQDQRVSAAPPIQEPEPDAWERRLRPHCRNPEMCTSYGAKHCRSCALAMESAAA